MLNLLVIPSIRPINTLSWVIAISPIAVSAITSFQTIFHSFPRRLKSPSINYIYFSFGSVKL